MDFRKRLNAVVLLPSAALFLLSLDLPAIEFEKQAPLIGFELLLAAWQGILIGNVSWWANPVYVVAVLCFRTGNYTVSLVGSGIALVMGLLSLTSKLYYFNEASGTPIVGFGPAAYIWLCSFLVLGSGSIYGVIREVERNRRKRIAPDGV